MHYVRYVNSKKINNKLVYKCILKKHFNLVPFHNLRSGTTILVLSDREKMGAKPTLFSNNGNLKKKKKKNIY